VRTVRIILGILFLVVVGRGIAFLGQGHGSLYPLYPAVMIAAGITGCLVLLSRKGKRGRGED
jgi:hypothetical protein